MVSPTEHTRRVRRRKHRRAGKDRKRVMSKHSTPSFPIHPETGEKDREGGTASEGSPGASGRP